MNESSHTSPIATPRLSDNRISLQPPRRRTCTRIKTQWQITGARGPNVQIKTCIRALDRVADGKIFASGFGAHNGDRLVLRETLEVEMIDWIFDAPDLVRFCRCFYFHGGEGVSESRKGEKKK